MQSTLFRAVMFGVLVLIVVRAPTVVAESIVAVTIAAVTVVVALVVDHLAKSCAGCPQRHRRDLHHGADDLRRGSCGLDQSATQRLPGAPTRGAANPSE